jgi:hypothetical protein
VFLDVDLDGYEDILVTTGFERDVQDADIANELEVARRERRLTDSQALALRAKFPKLDQPNLAFRNLGNFKFEEITKSWGFDERGVAQGMALADLDGDGDLDLVVNNMNAPASIFRNNATQPRIAVQLKGAGKNTQGIGAKIHLLGGPVPDQQQEMQAGGRYLSSDQALRVFAAGNSGRPISIRVEWPSGRISQIESIQPNSLLQVTEDPTSPTVPRPPKTGTTPPLFEDRSSALNHSHREVPFNDFERQPLLPRQISRSGPGVAWADLDGDGQDDLVIGAGQGSKLATLRNLSDGSFSPFPGYANARTEDQATTGILILGQSNAIPSILTGVSTYEASQPLEETVRIRTVDNSKGPGLTNGPSSTGPLAAADIQGDGRLSVFVGGRALPGRYPEPASSKIFHPTIDGYKEDLNKSELLKNLGLVNGAVFSDLEGDGFPELVVACEWGPLRIFRNLRGTWSPWDPTLLWTNFDSTNNPALGPRATTLSQLTGWWNGIATGDFNGDGRIDLVASNWGRNSKYEEQRAHPIRLYYGNFPDSGNTDVLEAFFDATRNQWFPWMHLGRVGPAIPSVGQRFHSFKAFAEASIAEVLGSKASTAKFLEAAWLETTVFLNTPKGFVPIPLPHAAQWSPAFAPCVADFNGDGHDDIFLSQNFFATEPETARYDAGRGLCLLGDGHGNFAALNSLESGIAIDGEQRGAAVGDYDADGRPDLVVCQNGTQTRLLHNVGAKPALRVRLNGPASNPTGIGAILRLQMGQTLGPAHEIHAGSGYWSQDSVVALLARPATPTAVEVTWPGGLKTSTPVPTDARELRIQMPTPAR